MKIIGVALKQGDEVRSLPRPARHSDVIQHMIDSGVIYDPRCSIQGFILEDETFLNREEALKHVLVTKQVRSFMSITKLYSQDLW